MEHEEPCLGPRTPQAPVGFVMEGKGQLFCSRQFRAVMHGQTECGDIPDGYGAIHWTE